MKKSLRVAIASYGPDQFALIGRIIKDSGHIPVVHIMSRSMKQNSAPEPDILDGVTSTLSSLPPDIGLLLPCDASELRPMLVGYEPDLLVVFGFNWVIPTEVIELPTHGTINVHPSFLPKHRGPSPIPWAIRDGEEELGMTIHRMTGKIDAGPILVQGSVGELSGVTTQAETWNLIEAGLPALLDRAIGEVLAGSEGTPQNEEEASRAGFPPPEWGGLSSRQGREEAHHQVRAYRFMYSDSGPCAELDGERVRILGTSLDKRGDSCLNYPDGPLWITEYEPM